MMILENKKKIEIRLIIIKKNLLSFFSKKMM